MCPRLSTLWALAAACVLFVDVGPSARSQSATPAEQYRTLLEEYRRATRTDALTDEERLKFVGHVYKLRNELALKLVELAEKHPEDPIALDALIEAVWQVNTIPWPVELVGRDDARSKAFALLQRDHVRSKELGTVCRRIALGFCREYEALLRAVLEKNPHREVRAQACLGLALFLRNRLDRLELIEELPELAREFEDLFGEEYLAELKGQDRRAVAGEAEALFEQAAREYGDIGLPGSGTVGERAEAALFAIRHLSVGEQAPDIEGRDQHGEPFKLSDYRGKVVLLDFWSRY